MGRAPGDRGADGGSLPALGYPSSRVSVLPGDGLTHEADYRASVDIKVEFISPDCPY